MCSGGIGKERSSACRRVGETLTAAQAGLAALLALCDAHVLCSTAGPSLASMGYAAVGGEDPGAWELHTGPAQRFGGAPDAVRAVAGRPDASPLPPSGTQS